MEPKREEWEKRTRPAGRLAQAIKGNDELIKFCSDLAEEQKKEAQNDRRKTEEYRIGHAQCLEKLHSHEELLREILTKLNELDKQENTTRSDSKQSGPVNNTSQYEYDLRNFLQKQKRECEALIRQYTNSARTLQEDAVVCQSRADSADEEREANLAEVKQCKANLEQLSGGLPGVVLFSAESRALLVVLPMRILPSSNPLMSDTTQLGMLWRHRCTGFIGMDKWTKRKT